MRQLPGCVVSLGGRLGPFHDWVFFSPNSELRKPNAYFSERSLTFDTV
jgi:hypothetical protein